MPDAAHAVDGTWTGGGAPTPNEWTQDNNWTPPVVPDNTATFTNNGAPTSVAISNDASINTIVFTTAAPAFSFVTSGTGITFNINGLGIVNNSAFAPSFTNNDTINFNSGSSAGNAIITNNNGSLLTFNNNSTWRCKTSRKLLGGDDPRSDDLTQAPGLDLVDEAANGLLARDEG